MGTCGANLIEEEQRRLDQVLDLMNYEKQEIEEEAKKAKADQIEAKGSKDGYGALLEANNRIKRCKARKEKLEQVQDELYNMHLKIKEYDSSYGMANEYDYNIGLYNYIINGEPCTVTWKEPRCRPYILNSSKTESTFELDLKSGKKKIETTLLLKRDIEIDTFRNKVTSVTPIYSIQKPEDDSIIYDEFLKELAERRSESEFKNIVFSIQKRQGEIVQRPFKENLIVQGCAGSGKSMIMLHRLPILLYDNPNSLDNNNLYIITPSRTYMQMAENMRYQLEIQDLKMGTINDYYCHVLKKYKIDVEKLRYNRVLHKAQETEYIYSEECIADIHYYIDVFLQKYADDNLDTLEHLGIKKKKKVCIIPAEIISENMSELNLILETNRKKLRENFKTCYGLLEKINRLARYYKDIRTPIGREIRKNASETKTKIKNLQIKGALSGIQEQEKILADYETELSNLAADNEYFAMIKDEVRPLEELVSMFAKIKSEFDENEHKDVYECLDNLDFIVSFYVDWEEGFQKIAVKYLEYTAAASRLIKEIHTLIDNADHSPRYLTYKDEKEYIEMMKYYSNLQKNIVDNIYFKIMDKINTPKNRKGFFSPLECSPYLYVLISYSVSGPPKTTYESLICIDEAQNLAPCELKLLQNVNGNKVILNLFGDSKQHIENTKGFDSWSDINHLADFVRYDMDENYRNATQITEYCNDIFGTNMKPINLDGSGVHKMEIWEDCYKKISQLFTKVKDNGLSGIIVKNEAEARMIAHIFNEFSSKMNVMVGESKPLHDSKWNIMVVEQVKGLEFGTIIVFTGRMTENEKYIAFTRALDELYIYDEIIEIKPSFQNIAENKETYETKEPAAEVVAPVIKKENINFADSKLVEYFRMRNLEVIDERNKGGFLWITGEEKALRNAVENAADEFQISGRFSNSVKTNHKHVWYTKAKK